MSTHQSEGKDALRENNEAQMRSYSRKRNLDSLVRTGSLPKSKNYKKVLPKLFEHLTRDDILLKKTMKEELKAQLEIKDCTFVPKINTNSLTMTRNNPKPPIMLREVPNRYKRAMVETIMTMAKTAKLDLDLATLKIPDTAGKKPDPTFYENKLAWTKNRDDKRAQAKVAEEEVEKASFVGKPVINDYSKNKIVPAEKLDNDEYLTRVTKTLQKKKDNIKAIEEKMYDFPFRPALYKPYRRGEIQIEN